METHLEVGDPLGGEVDIIRTSGGEAGRIADRERSAGRDDLAVTRGPRGDPELADVAVGAQHDLVMRLAVGEPDALHPAEQDDTRNLPKRAYRIEPFVDL